MPAFRFRAEAALAFRREREEAARGALAHADRVLHEATAKLHAAEETLASECRQFAGDEAQGGHATMFEWHRTWMSASRHRIAALRVAVNTAAGDQAAAASRLQRAHRDVRALERLRERAWRAFQAETGRREQGELDWLGTLKHTLADRQAKEES